MNTAICVYCQEEVVLGAFCSVCGAPLEKVREELIGHDLHSYHVEALIAEGGSGRIYRAYHRGTQQQVAIKVLLPELSANPKAIRRFRREAEVGIRLQHIHAVKLFEFGIDREIGLFLVMELIDGPTLSQALRKNGPFQPTQAIQLAMQICSVLDKAHRLEIIHRDLKPANVMLQQHPSGKEIIKICDFGTAKLEITTSTFDTMLTIPGTLCGTPGYMSPEQCRGEDLDARSDLYSLGILLFQMLTNELPFESGSAMEMIMQPLYREPRRLLEVEASLKTYPYTDRLQNILSTCMQMDRNLRYSDAISLSLDLRAALPAATVKNFSFSTDEEKELVPPPPPTSYPWEPVRLTPIQLQTIRNLSQQTPLVEFAPGQPLCSQGQPIDCFFLIDEGEIRLLSQSEKQIVEVDCLGPDEFIGVSSFFSRSPYTLLAEAGRLSKVHIIQRDTFAMWMSEQTELHELFREFYYEYLIQELIRYSPFFDSLTPSQRILLMREFEILPVGRGQNILEEGQMGEAFFLIASGQIEVYWSETHTGGKRRRSRFLKPGQFFGEISILTDDPVSASVRAHSNSVLLKLPSIVLFRSLEPYPRIIQLMHKVARIRLEENLRLEREREPDKEPGPFV